MAKRITLHILHTEEDLLCEIKKTQDGRYRLRVQAILLMAQKRTVNEIVNQLLVGRDTVARWVKLYNCFGLDGLKHMSYGGKPKGEYYKWDCAIFKALFEKLDLMEEFFSVPKMQAWIEETHGVTIPQNTIHNRLKEAGYSFKSTRPNPYKGDPALQASFKKMAL